MIYYEGDIRNSLEALRGCVTLPEDRGGVDGLMETFVLFQTACQTMQERQAREGIIALALISRLGELEKETKDNNLRRLLRDEAGFLRTYFVLPLLSEMA